MYKHPSTLLDDDYYTDNVIFIPHSMHAIPSEIQNKEGSSLSTHKLYHQQAHPTCKLLKMIPSVIILVKQVAYFALAFRHTLLVKPFYLSVETLVSIKIDT
jgi:hypothetical protein